MGMQQPDFSWMRAEPSGGLLQGLANVPISLFLKILLPLTAVFLLAFLLEYRAVLSADRAQLVAQETSVLHRGVRLVERELEIATGDLFFVADLAATVVDDGSPDRFAALRRSLLAFVRRRPGYLQIQLIGATGHEIVSIERARGEPRITPETELQDRSGRRDFIGTLSIESGEVFASTAEQNVDGGAPEQANQLAIRLATPIEDARGKRRGIVTLALDGGDLLSEFEQGSHEIGIQRMVVSSDGYWLLERSEAARGFVLERGGSFQNSFPEVWPQLLASARGRVVGNEGHFYFDTVAPDPLASGTEADGPPAWVFISLVPSRLLGDIVVRAATPLLLIATPAYFAFLAAGGLLASALQRRKLAEDALRSLEAVRSTMMTAALDGIVVMDDAGIALEFNPSAQRIFGYTLEEARGKLVADLIIPQAYRETHRLGLERYLATGERRIIDTHVDDLTGIRKNGEVFPVELTVCSVMIAGKQFFYGFLRDLGESDRSGVEAEAQVRSI